MASPRAAIFFLRYNIVKFISPLMLQICRKLPAQFPADGRRSSVLRCLHRYPNLIHIELACDKLSLCLLQIGGKVFINRASLFDFFCCIGYNRITIHRSLHLLYKRPELWLPNHIFQQFPVFRSSWSALNSASLSRFSLYQI